MELRNFVDEELYPALYNRLNEVFPEMGFKYVLGKWRSPYNLDGSTPQTPRRDKTVVTQRFFSVALENGGGDANGRARDLITLFMEHNGVRDRIEAIREISRKLSLTFPEGADAAKWEEERQRREMLTLSYSRQKEALFSQDGAEVLQYLKEERGYSEELIREMGLGYLSQEEARFLEDKCKVGIAWRVEEYPLSIAYFSRGNVIGFKFRSIKPLEGKSKYMNTKGLASEGMDNNPFGLTPQSLSLGDKKGEVVVVEGELDALHAIALGLPNVIAVAGGKVTEGKARVLKKYGYKNVVILLDEDAEGQRFTAESVYTIDKVGLNSLVATLPDAKDTDEYLQKHTIEELQEIIKNALFGGAFLYLKKKEEFSKTPQTNADLLNFLEGYTTLASRYQDPVKREMLFAYLCADFEGTDIEAIKKGIQEKVELQAAEDEKKRKREQAAEDLRKASTHLASGKGKDAINATQEALEHLKISEMETEYSFILEDNTDDLWRQYKENEMGLPTNIVLKRKEGKEVVSHDLFFPSGAVSVVGAPTGHGKSKVLQSIALDSLEYLEDGDTYLYITYEENELNVNYQFLGSYANLLLTAPGKKGNTMQSLAEYLYEGKTTFIKKEAREPLMRKEEEWKNIRRSRKIKIIKPEDNYLETLLGMIDFATSHLKIKAIFLDYIQEVYVRDWGKYSRTDELKEAMVRIDLAAQKYKIPIIMGAQLSREADSPLALTNQKIADSGWIERKASEIVLLWSNKEKPSGNEKEKALKDFEDTLKDELGENLELGSRGKLYFKLTKSRKIVSGAHAIIPINPNTGRVGTPKKAEEPKEGTLRIVTTPSISETSQPEEELPF